MQIEQTVHSLNLHKFESTVKDICKKFKIEYTIKCSEIYIVKTKDAFGNVVEDFFYDATVNIPEFDKMTNTGFTYLGCIKKDEVISVHPSETASDKGFALTSLTEEIKTFPCAECGKVATRKIIHVFQNDSTGKIDVYGSSCAIKKFGVDFSRLITKFSFLSEQLMGFDEVESGIGGYQVPERAIFFSTIAWNMISKYGYTSKAKSTDSKMATSESIWMDISSYYNDKSGKIRIVMDEEIKSTTYDHDAMLEFMESYLDTMEDNSDMKFNMENVFNVIKEGYVVSRMSGYVAYMVFLYWKSINELKESVATPYNENYDGINAGDKLKNVTVSLEGHFSFDGSFGLTHIYTFRDVTKGFKYKWISTNEIPEEKEFNISSCSIKALENHPKYGKSIMITRARGLNKI